MPRLGDAIRGLLREYGLEEAVQLHRAIILWEEIVGKAIAESCPAVEVRDRTIYVKAKSAAWRSEIAFQKENILNALNEKIGLPLLEEIRFC